MPIVNLNKHGGVRKGIPVYSYTGRSQLVDEGNGNWYVRFLTSGTLTITKVNSAYKSDITAIGGGGGGGGGTARNYGYFGNGGGGGGGGSISTATAQRLQANINYFITVGTGGAGGYNGTPGGSSSFDSLITAPGGLPGNGDGSSSGNGGAGGKDEVSTGGKGGEGKVAFDGRTYSAGGTGGASGPVTAPAGQANTGNGGGGGGYTWYAYDPSWEPGTNGGSGAVLWRNAR